MGYPSMVLVAWFPSVVALSQVRTRPDMTLDVVRMQNNKEAKSVCGGGGGGGGMCLSVSVSIPR